MLRKITVCGMILFLAFFVLTQKSEARRYPICCSSETEQQNQCMKIQPMHSLTAETLYQTSFEEGLPEGWETVDISWGPTWHTNEFNAYGGSGMSWWNGDPAFVGYWGRWWQNLNTPVMDLSGTTNPTLSFVHFYRTEDFDVPVYDGLSIWISTDGGATYANLTTITEGEFTTERLWGGEACFGDTTVSGWAGTNGEWSRVTFDLSTYRSSTVRIQFRFNSDWEESGMNIADFSGYHVDEITVADGENIILFDDGGDTELNMEASNPPQTGNLWTWSDLQACDGNYSMLSGDGNNLNEMLISPWIDVPEEGFPELQFFVYNLMNYCDPTDEGSMNRYWRLNITTDEIHWDETMSDCQTPATDSAQCVWWDPDRDFNLRIHRYGGQSIRIAIQPYTAYFEGIDTLATGPGVFYDLFTVFWRDAPPNDLAIVDIDAAWPVSVNYITPINISFANLGSNPSISQVFFYELLQYDPDLETLIQIFPATLMPNIPQMFPGDTLQYIFNWVPTDTGNYFFRAFQFVPDQWPPNDSLLVPPLTCEERDDSEPCRFRVFPAREGWLGYHDRWPASASGQGAGVGGGVAVRFSLPEGASSLTLKRAIVDFGGTPSSCTVYVFSAGTLEEPGPPMIAPFVYSPPAVDTLTKIDFTSRPDFANLEDIQEDFWIHFRWGSQTQLSISAVDDPTEFGRSYRFNGSEWSVIADDAEHFRIMAHVEWEIGAGCVGLRGDPTGDGNINVLDILAIANHILGLYILTGDALCRADCTGDGVVNILDALAVANVILGLLTECPGGGACKPALTLGVMELMESLQSYLPEEAFDEIMTQVKGPLVVPVEYSLAQNYPNPFNPVTSIQYTVASDVQTSLKIYNVLGQEVVTLVDEMKAPGAYTVEWDASDMASGVYFYRLTAGDYMAARRMVLMK